ncbi:MEDS domain-containing protein [Streptomyces sp. NPDC002564]|uniref:MEDS domain-containing protein n=1 Tax=Streptomyces sp. NPDC002564 TaxID=3364649 RepID=UPI0036B985CF
MRFRERQIHEVGHGHHLCLPFDDEDERQRLVGAYLSAGLDRGERLSYFSDLRPVPDVLAWLEKAGVPATAAAESGQLTVATAEDAYLTAGRFDPDAAVAKLHRTVRSALAAGFAGLRVSGEMSWALRDAQGAGLLEEYETKVNRVFAGRRASAICQYDTRRFGAARVASLDRRHPGIVGLAPLHTSPTLHLVPAFQAGQLCLRVEGEVDYHTADVFAAALRTVARRPGDVRVDMSRLDFIDLSGMRILAQAADELAPGRRLHLVELAPTLCEVIRVAGWDAGSSLVVSPPSP